METAKLFNETGVKTPIEFKIEKGKTRRIPKGERFCRRENHLNPRKDWLISYGYHEPIINAVVRRT